ncbi:HNH endonuclease [Corallococcus sp. EGB]|uniref:HNH endonuclease n=1 Tax=Corallococcus sp. EGB TaxID=1521117 RepID=UPI001CC024DB|nr:HNH endonuclease signature motif containing protein [Corallococcus sp. EGB]
MTMPRGVPKNGLWRGQESVASWVAQQKPKPCDCGCGKFVIPQPWHRSKGVPRFVHGHHARVEHWNFKNVAAWVAEQQGRHRCHCGCDGPIVILKRHNATGIPQYLQGHQPAPKNPAGPEHPRYVKDRSTMKPRAAATFSLETKRIIFDAHGGRCAWCRCNDALQFDHIVPVAEGGTGEPDNGQLLCANCHRWKSGVALDYRDRRRAQRPQPKERAA